MNFLHNSITLRRDIFPYKRKGMHVSAMEAFAEDVYKRQGRYFYFRYARNGKYANSIYDCNECFNGGVYRITLCF